LKPVDPFTPSLGPTQWVTLHFSVVDGGLRQDFFPGPGGGGSTNSVEDRGQSEQGSRSGSPLVRGVNEFANK
jgi:hypothetical protein